MNESFQNAAMVELSVLYEIPSLSFSGSLDDLSEEIIEKATRLFGVRRLALFSGSGEHRQLVLSWGFRATSDIEDAMQQNGVNQFNFSFSGRGEAGALFFEHARPLTDRMRRLYTVFARRVETVLSAIRIDTERRRAEEDLRRHREHLEDLVAERTSELDARNKELHEEILEREQVTEALQLSEEKYRTLFEASSDAIFLESMSGTVLGCNTSACKMLGYKKEELIGMTVEQLMPAENSEAEAVRIRENIRKGILFFESINRRNKKRNIGSRSRA